MAKSTSTRSRSSAVISLLSRMRSEASFWMAVARYSCLRAIGLLPRVQSRRHGRATSLSMSAMSVMRFDPRCKDCRRGSGPRLARDLSPFSSKRNSRKLTRDFMAPKSRCRILFLSRTSSRTCVTRKAHTRQKAHLRASALAHAPASDCRGLQDAKYHCPAKKAL